MQARILCVLPPMYPVATSPLEGKAALLAGGPGAGIGDGSSHESVSLISQTAALGIVDAPLHLTPQTQDIE